MLITLAHCRLQDIHFRSLILSADAQNAMHSPEVKAVASLFLPCIGVARLASKQVGAKRTSLLDWQLCRLREAEIVPYPLVYLRHDCGSLCHSAADLCLQDKRA